MKNILLIVVLTAFYTIQSMAQPIEPARPVIRKPPPPPRPTAGHFYITTSETCDVTINGKSYGVFVKDVTKSVSLPYGSYELVATNLETSDKVQIDTMLKRLKLVINIDLTSFILERQKVLDLKRIVDSTKAAADSLADMRKRDSLKRVPPPVAVISKEELTIKEINANLVAIIPKLFTMGSDLGVNDEGPAHYVTLDPIRVCKYEVTQKQWMSMMALNPSLNQGCDSCPVENVSFVDVEAFLAKINNVGKQKFRLPTEAEWEYIAGKGSEDRDTKKIAWYSSNSERKTHPVGTKQADALGLYDVLGNVAEWCSDWYGFNYYTAKTVDNPSGPVSGKDKVVRGGSFNDSESGLKHTRRNKQSASTKKETTGLRLVIASK